MAQQGLLRPIEVTSSNDSFSIGATAVTLPGGTYPCLFTLLRGLNAAMGAAGLTTIAYLDTALKVVFTQVAAFDLTFTDTDLGSLLGFRADGTGATNYTATDLPQYCWFPTYCSSDRNRFAVNQRNVFKGDTARSGYLVGIQSGADIYFRDFEWPAETASKVFIEACTEEELVFGVLTYYEETRTFEHFAKEARTAYSSDAANAMPRGCYYFPNVDAFLGAAAYATYPGTMGAGSINRLLEADLYVFCMLEPRGPRMPRPTTPRGKLYYEVAVELNTSAAPSGFVTVA